ncbi:hypothetical protein SAMN06298226_1806 [Nitrosovibrio sp. Nv4]|nr:hypothetical protein SAMN06298226_1806 [Nitrosovibrio sp. Nv4]
MALYKYVQHLDQSQHANFDKEYSPGVAAPDPGIYRCTGCGDEIGIAKGHNLPPQNHHQHSPFSASLIRWKLVVCAVSIK